MANCQCSAKEKVVCKILEIKSVALFSGIVNNYITKMKNYEALVEISFDGFVRVKAKNQKDAIKKAYKSVIASGEFPHVITCPSSFDSGIGDTHVAVVSVKGLTKNGDIKA